MPSSASRSRTSTRASPIRSISASLEGALIANVERGSAADRAGLKAGDVVRTVNGQAIIGSGDLPGMLAVSKPGEKVAMDVRRDGKIVRLNATLGNASDGRNVRGREEVAAIDCSTSACPGSTGST